MANDLRRMARKLGEAPRQALGLLHPVHFLVTFKNAVSLLRGDFWEEYASRTGRTVDGEIAWTLAWLDRSQEVRDDGVSCYQFKDGWTEGFPEVTGYVIPTYWHVYEVFGQVDVRDRALRMSEWLLTTQEASGGIQRSYAAKSKRPIVFDTAQALRGFVATYEQTEDRRYLEAATRAAEWIISNQDPDGAWRKCLYDGMVRVYDTYLAAPLYRYGDLVDSDSAREAAIRNCEWALTKQRKNGWFADCDNTHENNEFPITHAISYTVDGLQEVALMSGRDDLWSAAMKTVDQLVHRVETQPRFYGRWSSKWRPAASYVCLTGLAQAGIIFCRSYRESFDPRYLNSALKAVDFLMAVSHMNGANRNTRGGLPGSYPVWGLYIPLKFPSWAAKFYVDLLLDAKECMDIERRRIARA